MPTFDPDVTKQGELGPALVRSPTNTMRGHAVAPNPEPAGNSAELRSAVGRGGRRRLGGGDRFAAAVVGWGASNVRSFPWRETASPFHVLVAEVLLQRTPSWKVLPVWTRLVTRYATPARLSRAHVATLERMITPLGLIKRAVSLRAMARAIVEDHHGEVPSRPSSLLALPGVGPYVAAAVRCLAFGQADPMLDGVTSRVVKRYFDLAGPADDPDVHARQLLVAAVPKEPRQARLFNLALLDLAATICKPVSPRCTTCPLAIDCHAAGRTFPRATWRWHAPRVRKQLQ